MVCYKCPTCNAKWYSAEKEIDKCLRCNTPFYPEDRVEIKPRVEAVTEKIMADVRTMAGSNKVFLPMRDNKKED